MKSYIKIKNGITCNVDIDNKSVLIIHESQLSSNDIREIIDKVVVNFKILPLDFACYEMKCKLLT